MKHPAKPRSRPSAAAGVSTGADPPDTGLEVTDDYDDPQAFAAATVTGETSPGPGVGDAPVMDADFGEDGPGYDYVPPDPPGPGQVPRARSGFGARPGSLGGAAGQRAPGAGVAEGDDEPYGSLYQRGYAGGYQSGFGGRPGSFGGSATDPMYEDTDEHQSFAARYPAAARSRLMAPLRALRRPRQAAAPSRPGRQAQLTVSRVEPWSVMKFSFVISLVAFIVLFVAVAVLYGVLAALGVFDALERTVSSITSSQGSSGFNLAHYLSASRILGYAGLLGAVNVVLITALSTVGAVLYNITADLAGGVEVTLKETD